MSDSCTVTHQAPLWDFQARMLEWAAISFSRDQTWVSCLPGGVFITEPPGKSRGQKLNYLLYFLKSGLFPPENQKIWLHFSGNEKRLAPLDRACTQMFQPFKNVSRPSCLIHLYHLPGPSGYFPTYTLGKTWLVTGRKNVLRALDSAPAETAGCVPLICILISPTQSLCPLLNPHSFTHHLPTPRV